MTAPPRPLRQINPQIPVEVEQVIAIALAKEPDRRFKSVKSFVTALEDAMQSKSSLPPTVRASSFSLEDKHTFLPNVQVSSSSLEDGVQPKQTLLPTVYVPLSSQMPMTGNSTAEDEILPFLPSISSLLFPIDVKRSSTFLTLTIFAVFPFEGFWLLHIASGCVQSHNISWTIPKVQRW